jgi:hypothetical protein
MIVQVIKDINLSIKLVENGPSYAKPLVEETYESEERRLKDVLKLNKPRIGDWYTK